MIQKILLLFTALALSTIAYAQNSTKSDSNPSQVYEQPSTVKYYGEIVYTNTSSPAEKSIKLDFGVNSVFGKRYPVFNNANGNPVHFSTVVDALNFMSARGWVLELEYEDEFIDEGSSYGSVKHFLISKTLAVNNLPNE